MRVIFIHQRHYSPGFPPYLSDGWYLAGHTGEIARRLLAHAPDLDVENWRGDCTVRVATERVVLGVRCRIFPSTRLPYLGDFSWPLLAELDRVSRSHQKTIVHYGGIIFGQFLYTLARFHRKLAVVGNHQGDRLPATNRGVNRARMRKRLDSLLLPLAHHFLCAGQTAIAYLLSVGVQPSRTSFPEFGIDMDEFRPMDRLAARRELGLPLDAALLLHVGRADPSRGLPELLQSLPDIARQRRTRLVCVGVSRSDPLYARLHTVDALWTDWIAHERLPLYHNACDLLVRPADINRAPMSLGINVAETLACGGPAVAGTLTELPEYQRYRNVLGALPGQDLTGAILTALEQPRDGLAWQRREVVQAYEWERWLSRLIQIYSA